MTRRRISFWQGNLELEHFARDKRGNVAILFGLLIIPVLVCMGLAIDGLRALNAATTAHNALDASALAAARAMTKGGLSDSEIADVAQQYFRANVEGSGKVSYSAYGPLDVHTDRNTGAVTVSVDTSVETTLGQLAHIDQITMHRSATAVMGLNDIELGLMLDVTGSMNRNNKLRALKRATSDLIDTLIPEGPNADKVRIALAPYSEQVNVGRYADLVSDARNRTGCVAERRGASQNSDDAPSRANGFHVVTRREQRRYRRGACPPARIEPLTSDKVRLLDIVDGYRAQGWTAGHLGIQWAWNLISPRWSGVWPGGATPQSYGQKDLIKAVVLMTDGEFNTAYTGGASQPAMEIESYDHTRELCQKMKRQGVVVFTVAFDLRAARAEEALEDCASEPDLFLRAENEEELRRAYRNIAIKLTELRISQ